MLSQYEILGLLGRGATSDVFRARHHVAGRAPTDVALKYLRAESNEVDHIADFLSEAELVDQLMHPGVVELIDYGVHEGRPFQILELVNGISVEAALAEGEPASVDVALAIVADAALTLDYVHHAVDRARRPLRIVHRDITPANLLMTNAGAVKIADFGIARAFRRPRRTAVGVVRGTLAFMAPEQQRSESVDARTDIFALGCVLHTLIVGRSPLAATAGLEAAVAGDALNLEQLPAPIRPLVARATAARPEDRYPRARDFAAACERQLAASRDVVRSDVAEWVQACQPRSTEVTPSNSAAAQRPWLTRVGPQSRQFVAQGAEPTDTGASTRTVHLGIHPTVVVDRSSGAGPRERISPWLQWGVLLMLAIASAVAVRVVLGWVLPAA